MEEQTGQGPETQQAEEKEQENEIGRIKEGYVRYCVDVMRTSVFEPQQVQHDSVELNESGEEVRSRSIRKKTFRTSWGSVIACGPRLFSSDEDVLLALAEQSGTHASKHSLCRRVFGAADGRRYVQLNDSLAALRLNVMLLNARGATVYSDSLIRGASDENETYFTVHSAFTSGITRLITLDDRLRLRSPLAKALWRFIVSHADREWGGRVSVVAAALNLHRSRERDLHDAIKIALGELLAASLVVAFRVEGGRAWWKRR